MFLPHCHKSSTDSVSSLWLASQRITESHQPKTTVQRKWQSAEWNCSQKPVTGVLDSFIYKHWHPLPVTWQRGRRKTTIFFPESTWNYSATRVIPPTTAHLKSNDYIHDRWRTMSKKNKRFPINLHLSKPSRSTSIKYILGVLLSHGSQDLLTSTTEFSSLLKQPAQVPALSKGHFMGCTAVKPILKSIPRHKWRC